MFIRLTSWIKKNSNYLLPKGSQRQLDGIFSVFFHVRQFNVYITVENPGRKYIPGTLLLSNLNASSWF